MTLYLPRVRETTHDIADVSNGFNALLNYLANQIAYRRDVRSGCVDAVLVVRLADIDRFVFVCGMEYVHTAAPRLAAFLRQRMREKDAVYAISEREIGIILPDVANMAVVNLAINKIKNVIAQAEEGVVGTKHRLYIGATAVHDAARSADEVFRQAYIAMLRAKKNGQEFMIYSDDDDAVMQREAEIEEELEDFSGGLGFDLHYQPQLNLATGRISNAEVLLRWNSPRLGVVPPGLFIPIMERTGRIDEATEWLIHKTANFQRDLQGQWPDIGLCINISPVNLKNPALPQFIQECTELWNLEPGLLTLELTEGAMIEQPAQALGMLERLKAIGVKLSIDDFGTGYSSLQYLSRLPVDELKIDQSFIRTMSQFEKNKRIVNTVIDLARNFELEVVAEGVEDAATLEYLREIGCDKAQGYFISRPLPSADFMQYMTRINAILPESLSNAG